MTTCERERNHKQTDADGNEAHCNVFTSVSLMWIGQSKSPLLDLRQCDVLVIWQRAVMSSSTYDSSPE